MTPPWPFSTSPHCASTEPCGDKHSLGGWISPAAASGAAWVDVLALHMEGVEGYLPEKEIKFGITCTCRAFVFTFCTIILKDTFKLA